MLDADQQRIVDLSGAIIRVIAGAGSGKSTTLLARSARLSETGRVLCATFTSEAAKNLRTRSAKQYPRVDTSIFTTLHAAALRFAQNNRDAFSFKLADDLLADEGIATRAVFDVIGDRINFKKFTSWVGLQKRRRVSPDEAVSHSEKSGADLDLAVSYRRYQKRLQELGVVDFDDLLYYQVQILESRPDIRSKYQYDHVLIDEAQDCCELDWRLCQLLTQKHKSLTMAGDCGQAIFGFRGGVSKHFLSMEEYFPGTETYYLGRNYRSTPSIVSFGKQAYPYPEIAEHFRAVKTLNGVEPTITGYSTDYREAEEVVKKIKKYNPDECAVLARTNQALRCVEEECINQDVRYHILGDSSFWQATEVQNVLAYLRCAANPNDNAIIRAIQTPFHPTKYVSKKKVIEQLKNKAHLTKSSIWSSLGSIRELSTFKDFIVGMLSVRYMPAQEAVKKVIQDLKAVQYYAEEQNINPDKNPVDNIKEIIRSAARFESLDDFLNFVRRVSHATQRRSGVCLSTIHCSPPDEPVLTTEGYKKICDLNPENDRLYSYMPECNRLARGMRTEGYRFNVKSGHYTGKLVVVSTAHSKTRVTLEHKMRVRFSKNFCNKWVVYLMRRGDWWRIGLCTSASKPYKPGGVSGRLSTEKGDCGWILGVFNSKEEAVVSEAAYQVEYGIPSMIFEKEYNKPNENQTIYQFHEKLKGIVHPRAIKLLEDKNLLLDAPLYKRTTVKNMVHFGWFDTVAANLIDGFMEVPAAVESEYSRKGIIRPKPLDATIRKEDYDGEVFSLDVLPYHYYVSGGIVVHNSMKGKEAKNVFLISVNKDILPHVKSENLEEEKCAFFVGVSRAEEVLEISYYGIPSPFLEPWLKEKEESNVKDTLQIEQRVRG